MVQQKVLEKNTILQGRYLVVSLIGSGGMGEVYLAVDQRLGTKIALKRACFNENENLAQAFQREVKILANLRHPNLPKVIDHFEEGGFKYLVMEYVPGDDLGKIVKDKGGPFALDWVLFWADQLLEVLNYLHSQQPPVIHRDIKPQNLKLNEENNIILLDFGLAKFSTGEKTRIASDGSIVAYTPSYAPIEQIRGSGTTEKSDIYSLSSTLYYLLTARVPIDSVTRADRLLNSLPDPVEPISNLNPEVPKEISEVIMRGMSVASNLRYGSAREMQKALRETFFKIKNQQVFQTQTTTGAYSEPVSEEEQRTLILQDSQFGGKTLIDSSEPQLMKKTAILPEEIFPQVVSQEISSQQSLAESTIPLINFDSALDKASPNEKTEELGQDLVEAENYQTNYRIQIPESVGKDISETATESSLREKTDYHHAEAASLTNANNSQSIIDTSQNFRSQETASKKFNSLTIMISVLFVFALAAVVVGFGLYVFGDKILSLASPTPTATPSAIYAPEPTPEVLNTPELEESVTVDSSGAAEESEPEKDFLIQSNSNMDFQSDRKQRQGVVARDEKNASLRQEVTQRPKKGREKTEEAKPTPAKTPARLEILQ